MAEFSLLLGEHRNGKWEIAKRTVEPFIRRMCETDFPHCSNNCGLVYAI
jgi:hypothetical protein